MNILIVDDEKPAIEAILADARFEQYGIDGVFTANSMKQAQDLIQEQPIDIVMCDIEMPNGSGLDLIEWINRYNPDIVTLILSCHTEFEFARQAVSLACSQYILKPATPEVLAAALEKAVKQVEQRASEVKIQKLGEEYIQSLAAVDEADISAAEKVKRYITEHVDEELMVEKLAQMVYLSPNHLTRSFKKKFGKTVVEYISDYRMSLAEELLKSTELSVTAVSARVGYSNYVYFTKQFKRYSGYTPSQYRDKFGRGWI